jgi:hypothetical protein
MLGRDLCLDGGGVCGLSLQNFDAIKWRQSALKQDWRHEHRRVSLSLLGPKHELIGASFLAIMLGRLRMDVDSCIIAYTEMSDEIFQKKASSSQCHE